MNELVESHLRFPSENFFCFRGVTKQKVDLSWAFIALVMFDELLPIEIGMGERRFDELAYGMRFACSQHEVVALSELYYSPHAFDVFWRVSPVAFCLQIAKEQFLLQPVLNR